jgi:hypothetical protein
MKNYLVKGLHRIADTKWWPGRDRVDEGDLYLYYQQMAGLSEASFFHNLKGDWEYIKLESTATDVNHMLRQQFQAIWEIWSSEPCNIYYCGSDVQVMQPIEVFGKYKHFMMFNYTDPKSLDEYEHFLNADIRYYPAEMDRAMFEQALADVVNATKWNDDQKLYNRMLWSQGLSPAEVIDPTMAYQAPWIPDPNPDMAAMEFTNQWNGCTMEQSKVIHWHGSRNAKSKLQAMVDGNVFLSIPEIPIVPRETKTVDISHFP